MSPELTLLDDLLGGDLPVAVAAKRFASRTQLHKIVRANAAAGYLRVVDANGNDLPVWKLEELDRLVDQSWARFAESCRLVITRAGAALVG